MRETALSAAAGPRLQRWLPALLLVGLASAMTVANSGFRAGEAWAAQPLVRLATGSGNVAAVQDVVVFGLGTNSALGLQITPGCSTSVLIAPFLTIMAAIAAKSAVPIPRVALAALTGSLALVGVNLLRLSGIAWATSTWGIKPGFEISHYLVGSIFAILGFAATLMVSVRVLTGADRTQAKRPVHVGRHRAR